MLRDFSARLSAEFGRGFTGTNLHYTRQFYLMFPNHHALRDDSKAEGKRSAPIAPDSASSSLTLLACRSTAIP